MERRREDVLEEHIPLDLLLLITCPILSHLRDLLYDPRTHDGLIFIKSKGMYAKV